MTKYLELIFARKLPGLFFSVNKLLKQPHHGGRHEASPVFNKNDFLKFALTKG